jgi:uncharacterized membrane protein
MAHRGPEPVHRLGHHLGCDLIPTQIKQAQAARAFADSGSIPDSYWRLSRRWIVWGTVATLLPLANLYFMVVKPG